eukprot:375830_1
MKGFIVEHIKSIQQPITKYKSHNAQRCMSNTFFGNDVLECYSNKKETYLSKKKQMAELSNPWKPEFVGTYTKKMDECRSGDDILKALKQIEHEMDLIPDTKQFVNAIRKAASLRDYSVCFKIFDTAKTLHQVDVHLYTAMIWNCCQQRTVSSLN